MNILFIHQYFCPENGTGNDRSRALARRWIEAGHRVRFITSTAYFPPGHPARRHFRSLFLDRAGIEFSVWNVPYSQKWGIGRKAAAFLLFFLCCLWERIFGIKNFRPDVIYASVTPPTAAEAGLLFARKFGVPFFLETVDVWPQVPIEMRVLKNKILQKLFYARTDFYYRKAEHIFALSEGMKDMIASRGIETKKISVSPNGTDTRLFIPKTGNDTGITDNQRNDVPVIIYTGAVGRINGAEEAVHALAELHRLQPEIPFELHFYAWGNFLYKIKHISERLLPDRVRFFDPVPKSLLAPVMRRADIGLVTVAPFKVLEANSANKFYDYLASGLAVVLNYEGWQGEFLGKHHCGLSAPQNDRTAFRQSLHTLLTRPELLNQMKINARTAAVTHFDRNDLADQILKRITISVHRENRGGGERTGRDYNSLEFGRIWN